MYLRKLVIVGGIILRIIAIKIIIIPSTKSIEGAAFTVPRINSVNLLFSHALGARLGRFRNYVTAQPMQVTISSVFWIFPVALYNEFSVKFDLTVSMSRPLELGQK